jgi:quinoprotein glucose dehydrogenase
VVLTAAPVLILSLSSEAQRDIGNREWRRYGGDLGNSKYSELDQINHANVHDLRIAWTWTSIDELVKTRNAKIRENPILRSYGYEATPLMVGGTLYTTTSLGQVAALDPKTGRTKWSYDAAFYLEGRPAVHGFVTRGLAYWTDGSKRRLLFAGGQAWLISIDIESGKPDPHFGRNGRVDLTQGLGRAINRAQYTVTSPPLIVGDVAVVGSAITEDSGYREAPPGHVRGYDVRTGQMKWIFHTIPQPGEYGNDTWGNESWKFSGGANVWTLMSADEELNYVYLAVASPVTDFYGGHRPGDNLFANSLVCLNVTSGQRVWHFQLVHHTVWDYDLPAAPIVMDLTVDGRPIKAVAQITKQGFVFAFDRKTGQPVWPIEERAVPQSSVPGERTSPTQPYPTKPPMFAVAGITEDDVIDLTPELKTEALGILRRHHFGPLYTPPSLGSTIIRPGQSGAANWWGGAFDLMTGRLYVPSWNHYSLVTMEEHPDPRRSDLAVWPHVTSLNGPRGLPLVRPPYGLLTAFDMNRGERLWAVPLGDGPRNHPALKDLGLPSLGAHERQGGPLLTKTLLFIGQGSQSAKFRAFDKTTGQELWVMDLPARSSAAPMTYLIDGRQFVVLAIGGGELPDQLIALALPESERRVRPGR